MFFRTSALSHFNGGCRRRVFCSQGKDISVPNMQTMRTCVVCGRTKLRGRTAKYCSVECQKAAERQKRTDNREERLERRRKAYRNRKEAISNKYVPKACINCGKVVKMYASGQTKYCSECRELGGKLYREAHPELKERDYEKHRDWYREYNKKYYRENKATISEWNKEYYQKNRVTLIEKNRQYFLEHREQKLRYHRNYHYKNWDWMKEKYDATRKAYRQTEECKLIMAAVRQNRRANGWKKLTAAEIKKVRLKNERKHGELSCCYCQTPFRSLMHVTKAVQIEHLTPLSRGGSHSIRNLDLACIFCNASKGTMTKSEYLNSERFPKTRTRVRKLVAKL